MMLAKATPFSNLKKDGEDRVEKSTLQRLSIKRIFDIGFGTGTPVAEGYEMPFRFTGRLPGMMIELE